MGSTIENMTSTVNKIRTRFQTQYLKTQTWHSVIKLLSMKSDYCIISSIDYLLAVFQYEHEILCHHSIRKLDLGKIPLYNWICISFFALEIIFRYWVWNSISVLYWMSCSRLVEFLITMYKYQNYTQKFYAAKTWALLITLANLFDKTENGCICIRENSLHVNLLARSPRQVKLNSDKWKLWKNLIK